VEPDGRSYSTAPPIRIARFARLAQIARIAHFARLAQITRIAGFAHFAHLAPLPRLLLISQGCPANTHPLPGAAEKLRVVALLGVEKQLCRQRSSAAVK
jgi:hypothetical protein